MSFVRDVAIVGGCGRVGLPLGLVLGRRRALGHALRPGRRGGRPRLRGEDAVLGERRRRAARAADRDRPAQRHDRSELGRGSRARHPRGRNAGRRAPQPRPQVRPPRDRRSARPAPRRATRRAAQHCVPGRDRDGLEAAASPPSAPSTSRSAPSASPKARRSRSCRSLPQIISGRSERAVRRAEELFAEIAPSIVHLDVEEAELAKLFANTWRYIQFAAANQLFMIANDFGRRLRPHP